MELNLTKTSFGRDKTLNLQSSCLNKGVREYEQNKV
tara:strand:- start:571 stop:678 length:108 start_codon:yes stop_codon:yes gene_type:complete